jgi:IPT/TIG domain-containing protein
VPVTVCYPNPYQLAMDDAAAISRVYPVTAQNQSNFPGKQIFSATTARIHGSVWFTSKSGASTQPMQGANVVARWIDPATGQPSGRYAAASVSGFLFTGDAGNPITGFTDALGNAFSQFGATDPSLEGFFDLAGLQIPRSASSAQYQLSVEGLDTLWSPGVGPYAPYQVSPSGGFQPIVVTVAAGVDLAQDILMSRSAQPVPQWAASESWNTPAPVPAAGDWVGSLSGYGDSAYFLLPAQSNRTLSIAVTALDDSGLASEGKAQPVIGIWTFGDPLGTPPPAFTSSPFNSFSYAMTRLDAQIFIPANFVVGIADLRGDGRPDYHYHAHVLYGDSVSPARVRVSGGAITVHGTGFAPGPSVTIGASGARPLAVSASQMILAVPAQGDGPQTILITDPASGAFTTMTNALTIGAAQDDNIVLLQGSNGWTPVGTQAAKPMIIRALAADGTTPVGGATVGWSGTNGAALSICSGASACSTTTDDSGHSSTALTPTATGMANITATLAPGVYSPAKSVSGTLPASESSSDIGVSTPVLSIAQGATLTLPLTARVLSNGTPQSGVRVNFAVVSGSGGLSSSSATTNSNGYAAVTLSLTNFAAAVQVTACVAPANSPCRTITGNPVPPAQQNLQALSGGGQAISLSQAFQPVIVRVVDQSAPPNPVIGAIVTFQIMVLRPAGKTPAGGSGETTSGNSAMPVILSVNEFSVASDVNGLASVVPSVGGFTGTLEVDVSVTTGTSASLLYVLQALPSLVSGSMLSLPQREGRIPVPVHRPLRLEEW